MPEAEVGAAWQAEFRRVHAAEAPRSGKALEDAARVAFAGREMKLKFDG